MPRQIAPRQKLSYGWLRGEDYWGDPMSSNLVYTDAMLHPAPESMTLAVPPIGPVEGVQYIVPEGAEYAWKNYVQYLTMWIDGRWVFFKPFYGLRARVKDYVFVWFDGSNWVPELADDDPNTGAATCYDVAVSVGYAPEPEETLLILPIIQPMTLAEGAALSVATSVVPPPRSADLLIYRNGVQIGSVVFSPTEFDGAFLVPMESSFGVGDRLRVITSTGFPEDFGNFGIVLRMSLLA